MATVNSNESGTTHRNRLKKSIVLAIRTLMQQKQPDALSQDLAAYVVLALEKLTESVETSVIAWEKRDYWLKADHFRQEWLWAEQSSQKLAVALNANNWGQIALEMATIGGKLDDVQISPRHRLGEPWLGAWKAFTHRDK